MKYSNENYPWPVLTPLNDDFPDCDFSIEVEGVDRGSYFLFSLSYSLSADGIAEKIQSSEATVVVRIESPSSSFRTSCQFPHDKTSCELQVSKDDVTKTITFIPQIVATEKEPSYLPSGYNPLYFSIPFHIEKGNILAIGNEVKYYLDASELEKPISSIMTIDMNENAESSMTVNYSGERISILLDRETHTLFTRLGNTVAVKQFLTNTLVLPALVEALGIIQQSVSHSIEDEDTCSELRWFRVIEQKLKDMKFDLDDLESRCLTEVANTLLGESVRKSFRSIEDFMNAEENEIE